MKVITGWQLDETLGMYRIPIKLKNPKTEKDIIRYCLFDTGFSGYLGLDKESCQELGLKQISTGKAKTAKGIIDYRNYEVIAEIIDDQNNTVGRIHNLEESTIPAKEMIVVQGFDFPILGLKSIKQFSWLLLSEKNVVFLIDNISK